MPATLACSYFFLNRHGIKIAPNLRACTLFSGCARCCWWYRSLMSQLWVTEAPAKMQAVTCMQRTDYFHIVQPLLSSSNRRSRRWRLKTLDLIKCQGWGWGTWLVGTCARDATGKQSRAQWMCFPAAGYIQRDPNNSGPSSAVLSCCKTPVSSISWAALLHLPPRSAGASPVSAALVMSCTLVSAGRGSDVLRVSE